MLNCWLDNKEFQKLFKEKWEALNISGWDSFVAKEKLKSLKKEMKEWNKSSFGDIDNRIKAATEEIKLLDDKAESSSFSEGDIMKRRELFESFWRLSRWKDSIAIQKSRVRWLQLGDSNSIFFHACVNKRRRENSLHDLYIPGNWVEDPMEVKEEVFNHFKSLFDQNCGSRPRLDGIPFDRISASQLVMLTADFSYEEIKGAVWDCDGNRSQGRMDTTSTC